jgi:hypothetical protein
MKRDLVERARKGDHDAFAELVGAAISRLDATAWLMLRDTDRAILRSGRSSSWNDGRPLREPAVALIGASLQSGSWPTESP